MSNRQVISEKKLLTILLCVTAVLGVIFYFLCSFLIDITNITASYVSNYIVLPIVYAVFLFLTLRLATYLTFKKFFTQASKTDRLTFFIILVIIIALIIYYICQLVNLMGISKLAENAFYTMDNTIIELQNDENITKEELQNTIDTYTENKTFITDILEYGFVMRIVVFIVCVMITVIMYFPLRLMIKKTLEK